MSRKIKLIWDFRGPAAAETARHHEKHLKEYIVVENLSANETGTSDFSTSHSASYLVVDDGDLEETKNRLQPHRGEYVGQ